MDLPWAIRVIISLYLFWSWEGGEKELEKWLITGSNAAKLSKGVTWAGSKVINKEAGIHLYSQNEIRAAGPLSMRFGVSKKEQKFGEEDLDWNEFSIRFKRGGSSSISLLRILYSISKILSNTTTLKNNS